MKIMSYNIQHGVGLDNILSLERIAKTMRDSEAEIIGIQEVDRFYGERSNFEDQAKRLAKLLDYHYAYGPNIQLEPLDGQVEKRQYGLATLSKHPIAGSKNIELSSYGQEQRGVLSVTIHVNGVSLNIFNTHLGLDGTSRMTQVKELINITSNYRGPKVLLGDFNADPNSEELQYLLNQTDLVDSFQQIKNAYTFPAVDPVQRIDYIFTSSEIKHSNQKVLQHAGSDHLPIVAELLIENNNLATE
ncbi:endonuclease/exonuclease/phosphatase family protein [Bacillus sp. FSL K6-3431]|uniref:endonuclease/exonuclease/phosphatase family protein n=1 Tax=Bacillus sp. FSL K6-3431 TaxID=2921500 RepID=UPI0030F884B6